MSKKSMSIGIWDDQQQIHGYVK